MAEARFGHPITDDEYDEAARYARMKLDFQNDLFKRNYGDDYLAILIAETVNQNRLDAYHKERDEIFKEFLRLAQEQQVNEEQEWVQKMANDSGVSCAVVRELVNVLGYPYCITLFGKTQYGGIKNVGQCAGDHQAVSY